MGEFLTNTIGQSLLALGMYTVAFESLVLTFRAQMHGYLTKHEPTALPNFSKACETADKTLKFCEPHLVRLGVLAPGDCESLVDIRRRRNKVAHEGYNQVFSLKVKDIESDVLVMFQLATKVENWHQAIREVGPDGSMTMYVAPRIFGLWLQIAQELAMTKLRVDDEP